MYPASGMPVLDVSALAKTTAVVLGIYEKWISIEFRDIGENAGHAAKRHY